MGSGDLPRSSKFTTLSNCVNGTQDTNGLSASDTKDDTKLNGPAMPLEIMLADVDNWIEAETAVASRKMAIGGLRTPRLSPTQSKGDTVKLHVLVIKLIWF